MKTEKVESEQTSNENPTVKQKFYAMNPNKWQSERAKGLGFYKNEILRAHSNVKFAKAKAKQIIDYAKAQLQGARLDYVKARDETYEDYVARCKRHSDDRFEFAGISESD